MTTSLQVAVLLNRNFRSFYSSESLLSFDAGVVELSTKGKIRKVTSSFMMSRNEKIPAEIKQEANVLKQKLLEAPKSVPQPLLGGDYPLMYKQDYQDYGIVTPVRVESWRFGFRFSEFKNHEPLFVPVLYLNDKEDSPCIPVKECQFKYDESIIAISAEQRKVFVLPRTDDLSSVLSYFAHQKGYLYDDAAGILREFSLMGIDCDPGLPDFKKRNVDMKPMLEMAQGKKKELWLLLQFDYEGQVLPFRNEPEEFILSVGRHKIEYAQRDLFAEQRICNLCLSEFGDMVLKKSYYYVGNYSFSLDSTIQDFLFTHGEALIDAGVPLKRKGDRRIFRTFGGFSFTVNSGIDWLELNTEIISEDGREALAIDPELLEQQLVSSEDSLYMVRRKDIERLKQLYYLGMTEKGTIKTAESNIGLMAFISEEIADQADDRVREMAGLVDRLKNFEGIERIDADASFGGELRPYQQAGLSWLNFLHEYRLHGCLADDMGLGKTVQTLALLHRLHQRKELEQVLIVVPLSTMANWEREIMRFTPEFSVRRHQGANRPRDLEEYRDDNIILVSYQTLRNDVDIFSEVVFSYIILDEAQNIKNASSKVFRSIRRLRSEHRLSLTGTPVENNSLELWSQMDFLNPGLLGSIRQFRQRFMQPIEDRQNQDAAMHLRRVIFPYILRRKKEDVLKDLPEKQESVILGEMEDRQRDLYHGMRDSYRRRFEEDLDEENPASSSMDILQALLRLRQISILPELVSDEYADIDSGKMVLLRDLIQEILSEDHKVLIFSGFLGALARIRDWLEREEVGYSYLDGSTRDRGREIEQFQTEEERRVFLLSIKAGSLGINLTAADYVIILDPWWNPAVEAQAIDRSHRIGQNRPVTAYRLIAKDSIEEKIIELQNRKRDLVDKLVTTDNSFLKSLSKDDILTLFDA